MINVLSTTACMLTMVGSYLVAQGQLKAVYVLARADHQLVQGEKE